MANSKQKKVIFLGDIVGRPGRQVVKDYLDAKKSLENNENYFVIANVENASGGFGLSEKNHNELIETGIDCFTSGNHIWDRKEIFNYIGNSDRLIRPINYPVQTTPGVGSKVFELEECKIGVINVLGRIFMPPIDSPWEVVENEVKKIKELTNIIIIDFHAEATAEKMCFARWCASLGISALIGTHTHVQTSDAQIISSEAGKTAYITDAGFCGCTEGVIGMDYTSSLTRLKDSLPERFEVLNSGNKEANGVEICIDINSGDAIDIKSFKFTKNNNEVID